MISHKHRVIFVHIPKTAGQSIERVFLAENGLDWDNRAPLLLKANDAPGQGPERLAHLYAGEYVALGYATAEQFRDYFKFAVVRDPYDRLASAYRFKYPKRKISFREFVENIGDDDLRDSARHTAPQHRYVFGDDGSPLVDRIVRFERLADEWPELSRKMFGREIPLPHANGSADGGGEVLYDAHTRALARDRYALDFERFDYPAD